MKALDSFMMNKRLILAYSLLAGSLIIVYFPVLKGLIGVWGSQDEYSHGFLILPLSLYIAWRKKDSLRGVRIQPSRWGLALVLSSLVVYIFAQFAGVLTLAPLSLVFLIAAAVIYLCGFQMLRELAFPLLLLLFMIPLPTQIYSALTMPLQLFVSKTSAGIAHLMGLSVYREGNVIHLADRSLEVVQACSGLRSMISLLTLSAIFGYFTLRSSWLKALLFLSGVPAAIGANVVRIVLLVVAFYWFDFDLTKGTAHDIFGIAIFFIGLALIVLTRGVLSIWDRSATKE